MERTQKKTSSHKGEDKARRTKNGEQQTGDQNTAKPALPANKNWRNKLAKTEANKIPTKHNGEQNW